MAVGSAVGVAIAMIGCPIKTSLEIELTNSHISFVPSRMVFSQGEL